MLDLKMTTFAEWKSNGLASIQLEKHIAGYTPPTAVPIAELPTTVAAVPTYAPIAEPLTAALIAATPVMVDKYVAIVAVLRYVPARYPPRDALYKIRPPAACGSIDVPVVASAARIIGNGIMMTVIIQPP